MKHKQKAQAILSAEVNKDLRDEVAALTSKSVLKLVEGKKYLNAAFRGQAAILAQGVAWGEKHEQVRVVYALAMARRAPQWFAMHACVCSA